MLCNVQDKYHNNRVATDGYILGEFTEGDCPKTGDSFYIAAVPEETIILGLMCQLTNQTDTDTVKFKLQIGEDDCKLCASQEYTITGSEVKCFEFCKCKKTTEQSIVKLTLTEYAEGSTCGLQTMLNVFNPENIICQSPEYKLDTHAFAAPACPTNGCEKTCKG